ncbi:hypothetical protein [Clostridium tertium]|jgi:hypothetical protein|uniref:hypothetical protein n=1 Tax=Clostridium tertium TaxID=1559 RepID=UPI0018AAEC55|nr:hypothetical protein [Clostridium tertium]
MDIQIACNEVASNCAKLYVEANLLEYKASGYSKLVEDFTYKYAEAYAQAEKQLKDLPTPKVKFLDKRSLGL